MHSFLEFIDSGFGLGWDTKENYLFRNCLTYSYLSNKRVGWNFQSIGDYMKISGYDGICFLKRISKRACPMKECQKHLKSYFRFFSE